MDKETLTACVPSFVGRVVAVNRITAGLSGAEVMQLETEKGFFILRRFLGDREAWVRSRAMHLLASDHQIAPRVISYDDEHQILISEKIEAESFGAAASKVDTREKAFSSLVTVLAKMRTISCETSSGKDPVQFAEELWRDQTRRASFPDWAMNLAGVLTAVKGALDRDPRRSFCHGDLNPANALWDRERVWIVDWDDASANHPFLDLAVISNFLSLPEATGRMLLQGLIGQKPDPTDEDSLAALRALARIVYGLVFLRLIPDLRKVTFKPAEECMSLSACFALTTTGRVSLGSDEGAAMIAAAFFKEAVLQKG